ncbi:MAG: pilin [Patescibacteria group bacterium]|nr:pilin [Patescibacteria group bacterium]MDD5715949.1 pilin [Patescibacteria group bacterium]
MRITRNTILQPILLALCVVCIASAIPSAANAAQATYPEGFKIIPDCALDKGNCDLDDFVQLFVNLAGVALRILPYLAMIMMIWAGFNLIMAGGNPQKIQEGKKMISSIVVGMIIVIVLAWCFAHFVVFILTGSFNIFPGYGNPLEREWWGGGTTGQVDPEKGCCVIKEGGCVEETREQCECRQNPLVYICPDGTPGLEQETNFMGEGEYCYSFEAACTKFKYGCCIPKVPNAADPGSDTCYVPDDDGCLKFPGTTHNSNICAALTDICDPSLIQGTQDISPDATGCCVKDSSCAETTFTGCTGTFNYGVSCNNIEECKQGCCVAPDGCISGKIDCAYFWNASKCTEPPNIGGADNCRVGCCITNNSTEFNQCENNQTALNCSLEGDSQFFSATDCSTISVCANGCCLQSCTSGSIDGSCGAYTTYRKSTTCAASPDCVFGCCLKSGATRCVGNVLQGNCVAPDTWIGAGACDPAVCATGCCELTAENYRCVDETSTYWCLAQPGHIFYLGDACSEVNNCTAGGYCIYGGTCYPWGSPHTQAECVTGHGGVFYPAPATCPS